MDCSMADKVLTPKRYIQKTESVLQLLFLECVHTVRPRLQKVIDMRLVDESVQFHRKRCIQKHILMSINEHEITKKAYQVFEEKPLYLSRINMEN